MPGRKPKPTGLKVIEGTFRKDRANPDEPQVEIGAPERPKYVKGEARKLWDDLVAKLTATRILAKQEQVSLAALCVLHGKFVEAVKTNQPLNASMIAQYRALMAEFGLTPSSRSKVRSKPAKTAGGNSWEELAQ